MKISIVFAFYLVLTSSCSSEYNERLNNAKKLKKELQLIIENTDIEDKLILSKELKIQIELQAKISGNEKLFYSDLKLYNTIKP